PARWQLVATLQHQAEVYAVGFSPDGDLLATGGRDRAVRLWRAEDGRALGTSLWHPKEVLALSFTPKGDGLLTAAKDNTLRLWQIATDQASLARSSLESRGDFISAFAIRAGDGKAQPDIRLARVADFFGEENDSVKGARSTLGL